MRLVTIAAAALLAAALPTAAEARQIRAAGPVVALATTAHEVAYAATTSARCTEIRVWDTADRGVRRYARQCFAGTSTGSGVAAVAVANRRALWLTYTGGNLREWSLWTKTRTSKARRIAFDVRDVDSPAALVVGSAWDGSLPYALDRTVIVLRPNGARAFGAVQAPDRVVALSAHARGYAAVLSNGDVFELSPSGAPLRTLDYAPGEVQAAVSTERGLLVMTRSGIDVHEGRATSRTAIAPGWRFGGYSAGHVAYRTATHLRLRRLADERDVAYRRPAPAHVQLGRLGLGSAHGPVVTWRAGSLVRAAVG